MGLQLPPRSPSRPDGALTLDPATVNATFVLATFDAATDAHIRGIWERLSSLGMRTPIDDHEPPHISFGGVELLDIPAFQRSVEPVLAGMPLALSFSHVGVFGGGRFMWLGTSLDESLRSLHERTDAALRSSSTEAPDAMYLPGKWIPHCTLANSVSPEQMPDFWRVLRAVDLSAQARLEGLQLVNVSYPRT